MQGALNSAQLRASVWYSLLIALVALTLCYILRLALNDLLVGYPYATFYIGVLVVALIAPFWASLLTILISALLAGTFAIDSHGAFLPQSRSAILGTLIFILVGLAIAVVLNSLRTALADLSTARDELHLVNQTLETRVAERTRDLTEANALLIAETTARQQAEALTRQMQKMEAIGQLSGGIAHDFNNMLAIIMSSVSIARRRLDRGDTNVGTFLDGALDGAQRAANLTQRLLAFSRKQPLNPSVTEVNGLVRGVEDMLRRALGETVRLEFALGGGLWRAQVDNDQLESALINLAINARDAMPEGGSLTIETMNAFLDDAYAAAHAEVTGGQYVLIAVSDTGQGMPDAVIEKAFEPFFTTKETGKGTGLGLSQVYGFIKQTGGHIKIYSEAGQGTTVKIYLPRSYGTEESQPRTDTTGTALPRARTGETVLLVEDDEAVRAAAILALDELGYTVIEAASGAQALRLLDQHGPVALLFTDVVMPGMSGRMLAEAALALQPGLKVVYTTGYTANAIVHNGMIDPGVELLTKPYDLGQLARKLRRVLDAG